MIRAWIAYTLYRRIFFPLGLGLLTLALPFLPRKLREMVLERRREWNPTPLLSAPVWIHAASGEIEYAKPVIRALKEAYPELPILVTYFSPSAKKLIENFPGVDQTVLLPWDREAEINQFFDFYKPRAALFARTDLWPNFVTRARERGIPTLLFAATMGDRSSRLRPGPASLSRWLFSRMDDVYCVAEEDRLNFERLSKRLSVRVAGDTRYDQALARLNAPKPLPGALKPGDDEFTFIAGSTWPEDEDVLIPALPELINAGIRCLLVPHEVGEEHLRSIETALRDQALDFVRFSRARAWPRSQVLIVDQVGLLADLYAWSHVAFVGGSFRQKVHSVMEPLAAGLPVLVGPYHRNNREALQFREQVLGREAHAVEVVNDGRQLRDQVLLWKNAAPSVHEELRLKVRQKAGASNRVVRWVEEKLGLPK